MNKTYIQKTELKCIYIIIKQTYITTNQVTWSFRVPSFLSNGYKEFQFYTLKSSGNWLDNSGTIFSTTELCT